MAAMPWVTARSRSWPMLSGRCAVVAQVLQDFRVDRLAATSPDSIRILGAAGLHEQSWNPAAG